MARKRKSVDEGPRPNSEWVVRTEIQINGRNVLPGTELKISGERGRFRFVKHVVTEKGNEWIDVIGGPRGCAVWRSFHLSRVKTVHYKNRTDASLAVEHKEKMKAKRAEAEAESETE